jgi:methionine gamma-lyase
MTSNHSGFATRAIHGGYDRDRHYGALNPPVYLTSTYAFPSIGEGSARFAGDADGYVYGRVGNPTVAALEARLCALEGAEAALVTASGMGAITAAIWTLVAAGDEIVADKTLYGCTYEFFAHGLARLGVTTRFVDLSEPENLVGAITANTRVVFCETPANPNLRLCDIRALAGIAHDAGATLIVDNTYCTPYLQQPLALGADLVVHSATKYLGGHGDLLAGAVLGRAEMLGRIRFFGLKDMTGAVASPFDAYLILRGLKTLALRMERHCASAATIAGLVAAHHAVASVAYPGLPDFPQRSLAARQMKHPGGMIAFELKGGLAAGIRFMDALTLVSRAVSLGDAETLVQHPASMTHAPYAPEIRAQHGISDGLVRLSIGLEEIDDLSADIVSALDQAR